MRGSRFLMCLGLALLADAFAASVELNPVRTHSNMQRPPAVQRVIVKLRALEPSGDAHGSTAAAPAALAKRASLVLMESHRIAPGLHVLRLQPAAGGESIAATLARLRADSAVEYAEADQRRYAQAVPDDPLFTGQWYLQSASATPSAVDAESAWNVTSGSTGIVIADIDSGVRFDHPDLLRAGAGDGGRLLPGYDFVFDAVAANDGDGRDADASDPGDWVSMADTNTAEFTGCTVADSSWHGTRVVGILGAITNNASGVAGLTWNSWILPVRALAKCGGDDSDIEAAMLWAGGIHVDGVPDNPYPANIENLSIGAPGSCPQSYQEVISQLTARGVLVVVSAGNDGGPVAAPANCPGVAAIAGLRHAGTKVGFSNLGPEIALAAPAGNCVNTTAGSPCVYSLDTTYNLGKTTPTSNGYTDQTTTNLGTSFSAPIVSGIAALMLAVNGNLKSGELIARLQEGAQPFPQTSLDSTGAQPPACHVPTSASDNTQDVECICTLDDMTCGAGMANASQAVAAALRPIAAVAVPTSVTPGGNVSLQGAGSAAACHHTISTHAWSIVSGTSSGISGANTDTAIVVAPAAGAFSVRLTVTDDAGRQDTADVTVSSNAATTAAAASAGAKACPSSVAVASPVGVSVSPTSASLKVGGGTQAFTATVTDTTDTAVTWQVNNVTGGNASLGTISAAGVYTPPATLAASLAVTVTAVSIAVKTQTGSAEVTVAPAVLSGAAGGASGTSSSSGGGAIDLLMLLALLCVSVRRARLLFLALRHSLRDVEPLFLRPAIVRRRNARLL